MADKNKAEGGSDEPRSSTKERQKIPMVVGEVEAIGDLRLVCIPAWLVTRVGMAGGTVGILLPPTAAEELVAALRHAGVVEEFARGGFTMRDREPQGEPKERI